MSEEILAGRNSVLEALRSGRSINKIFVQDGIKGGSVSEIIAVAKEIGVVIEFAKIERLDKLASGIRHQGFVALVAPIRFHSLEEVLAGAEAKGEVPFLLLLDELQDPQNVGALIRTADAAGVHGVLMPKRRSCPLNAVVAKISAGAVEYVPVVQIGNIPQTIEELKKLGFWVAGADMDGEDYYKSNLTGPMVVVVGAEGKGLGRLVKEKCDIVVSLPMQGGVSSLNAAAAGAVLLYEVVRQRRVQAGL
ncbi:23S rRNA (guanosine(2251)-2'-O)-methyltransferase RlmB [Phascolarctobacterium sp.]|uniref:23S rRNA (guanosine(2251)-2'-O)-methyltransferase RlmB n=1 Tax=Phascolarctobacterium sp. TaxID=2049039 RepID=UPI0015AEFED2|nr:23S rRNA (guanosine(2251)-2'-O)-methyltransferase RlmB [uncultured Phascolarctobacterium sp.]